MLSKKVIEYTRNYFYDLHDNVCNQKYNKYLPYSFHLDMVEQQALKFKYLLKSEDDFELVLAGCIGHDSIEDARITYNDIKDQFTVELADIIYLCTEEKGKNRAERKNNKFYSELKTNRLAVFVKLCDIMANVKFSLLSNSTMYDKAKYEFPKIKEYLYSEEFKDMFEYLEAIFKLN